MPTKPTKPTKPTDVYLHGEAMMWPSSLPKTAKKIQTSTPNYHIIADSETTGNHHVVDVHEGVEFFMDEDGTMFMVNEKPTDVRCLHPDRHSSYDLSPGCWEFGLQQEFDHLLQHQRNVRD